MAGDWIKMRHDLAEDPAVIAIAERLGELEETVVGRLHRFWSWVDRQSRDGHAVGVTLTWLDRYIRRDGFAAAMVAVGWLADGADGLAVPNFERHNGETAKTRALSSNRKRRQRSTDVTPESREVSRCQRDESGTREEKRREEESTSPNGEAPRGSKKASKRSAYAADSRPYRAAEYLRDRLLERNPEMTNPHLEEWAHEFELLFRDDGREPKLVREVIDFVLSTDRWTFLQSPGALRKKKSGQWPDGSYKFDSFVAEMRKSRTIRDTAPPKTGAANGAAI